MSPITIIARVMAKKESVEKVRSELFKLIAPTRREEGCIEYRLHQDNEDPSLFIFYENWESAAALGNHITSDHYKAYVKASEGLIEGKVIHKLTGIEPECES